ncbi:MAG: hypothetical protein L6Q97_05710 [Thermoanaerobaculia bacterium]|nr:hypothetical protein [Thermoanaerobaculia bacterium]
MAEKFFFDILKEKMAAIKPSVRHREADWVTLSARLDHALPGPARKRRLSWLPLLLLFLALGSSNLFWWQNNREYRKTIQRLEVQLAGLQTTVTAIQATKPEARTDTIWKNVYIRIPAQEAVVASGQTYPGAKNLNIDQVAARIYGQKRSFRQKAGSDETQPEVMTKIPEKKIPPFADEGASLSGTERDAVDIARPNAALRILKTGDLNGVATTIHRKDFMPAHVLTRLARSYIPVRPFGPVLLHAIKPKYLKIGAIAGWLQPLSPSLIHEIGFEAGVQANIGFSRHWSIVLEYTFGQLHYESNDPNAILGAPALPPLPSPAHHFEHLDLQRQPLRQFGMGLRYTFLQPGKVRPYIGLQWGGQTVMPYRVEYEIRHEPSNTSETAVLTVENSTYLRNTLRFGAGLDAPLFKQLHFTAEGFYLGQWKKQNRGALDMIGLRVGTNWLF